VKSPTFSVRIHFKYSAVNGNDVYTSRLVHNVGMVDHRDGVLILSGWDSEESCFFRPIQAVRDWLYWERVL
jgi:hypothetical protein